MLPKTKVREYIFTNNKLDDEVGNVLLHTIHSAPTTTKRRI